MYNTKKLLVDLKLELKIISPNISLAVLRTLKTLEIFSKLSSKLRMIYLNPRYRPGKNYSYYELKLRYEKEYGKTKSLLYQGNSLADKFLNDPDTNWEGIGGVAIEDALFNEGVKRRRWVCRQVLQQAILNSYHSNPIKSTNEIINGMKCLDYTETNEKEYDELLEDIKHGAHQVENGLKKLLIDAYIKFRKFPSAENYSACKASLITYQVLGGNHSQSDILKLGYPVIPWEKCKIQSPHTPGIYTVKKGDSLSKIAERIYGNENLWDALYEVNNKANQLGLNPDLILPGTKLTILDPIQQRIEKQTNIDMQDIWFM